METSKKITWVLIVFFLLAIVAVGAVRIVFQIDISSLLNYVMPLTTSCTLAYFGKASMENVTKIKTGATSGVQVDTNNVNIQIDPSVVNNAVANAISEIKPTITR
jgi:hypothetical protein